MIGGTYMSKYLLFYERTVQNETLGGIQFQDLNSE